VPSRIVEIAGRSTQGITRPFLCRADDSLFYYVKGNVAGRAALVAEWISGHLAQRLGLPIPQFKQVLIPERLVQFSARADIADLGAGTGFASHKVENANELTYLYIEQIDPTLRARILLFDWWVLNGDRTLSEHGGNPNILWVYHEHRPFIIDHNLAFDQTTLEDFWSCHIFATARNLWSNHFRRQWESVMKNALNDLETWWRAMPLQWTEVPGGPTLQQVRTLLSRFESDPDTFWGPHD
jgi:hypothetical protein